MNQLFTCLQITKANDRHDNLYLGIHSSFQDLLGTTTALVLKFGIVVGLYFVVLCKSDLPLPDHQYPCLSFFLSLQLIFCQIFSSPELKAPGELRGWEASLACPSSVHTFKQLLL